MLQIYDIESIPEEDLGYSPQEIVDVLGNTTFLQARRIRLHSELETKMEVTMSAPQLEAIVTDCMAVELAPGKQNITGCNKRLGRGGKVY